MLRFKSRQAYYKQLKRVSDYKTTTDKVVILVKEARHEQYRKGTRKVYLDIKPELNKLGIKIGRDKLFKLLKDNDLLVKPKKKKYTVTTDSKHFLRKHKNKIKNIKIDQPEKVFVSDITYIKVNGKSAFLFLITDAYSKKIMGWNLDYSMSTSDGIKALKKAVKNKIYNRNTIHHSDRGLQYCSFEYIKYLKKKNMIPSMTEDQHVYENAIAERVNGILKQEFDIGLGYYDMNEAQSEITKAIEIYNNKRRHISLDYSTPDFIHKNPGIVIKTWKSKNSKTAIC